MNVPNELLKERLLARQTVPPDRLDEYRMEVRMLLDQKVRSFAREKKVIRWLWIYLVLLSTTFLVISGTRPDSMRGLWFGILACFWFFFGAVFLLQNIMNRHQLEMLTEVKALELRVLEMQQALAVHAAAEGDRER